MSYTSQGIHRGEIQMMTHTVYGTLLMVTIARIRYALAKKNLEIFLD